MSYYEKKLAFFVNIPCYADNLIFFLRSIIALNCVFELLKITIKK